MNIRRLHKDQRGLTIIELLVVMVLTALITTAITTTFFQVFDINTRTANHMSALSQVQQAGKLVSEDILEAQEIDGNPSGPGEFLILGWNSTGETHHEITYTLEDGELWRSETIGEGVPETTRVAEYIDADQSSIEPHESCQFPNCGVYKFTVTATVGEESEQRLYRVQPRPGT
jgi:prepilin-type N-terminal cleavage/methylation domain-containing protein